MRIGVDVGGSKIEVVGLTALGDEVCRKRVDTPQGDYNATLEAIVSLINYVETTQEQASSIGIGTPGSPSSLTGLMKNCNSTCLNHQALQQDIEQRIDRPVRLANDANCFALSEAIDGAGQGADCVWGVILGTGVGSGIVINQQPRLGANHIAGEWGHNCFVGREKASTKNRRCYCGRENCNETFLSGPGFAITYQELGGQGGYTAKAIAEHAQQGDPIALKALALYQEQLAFALAQVINVIDPTVIVLGGGISNIQPLYENVPRLWAPYIFNDTIQTRLLPAHYGDSSGVRGAAWLWD